MEGIQRGEEGGAEEVRGREKSAGAASGRITVRRTRSQKNAKGMKMGTQKEVEALASGGSGNRRGSGGKNQDRGGF